MGVPGTGKSGADASLMSRIFLMRLLRGGSQSQHAVHIIHHILQISTCLKSIPHSKRGKRKGNYSPNRQPQPILLGPQDAHDLLPPLGVVFEMLCDEATP